MHPLLCDVLSARQLSDHQLSNHQLSNLFGNIAGMLECRAYTLQLWMTVIHVPNLSF
jgi:hypothetical protein